jgi:6-phosphogluconolactonase/glucosamine-6-phosphate isomerase/deaminase
MTVMSLRYDDVRVTTDPARDTALWLADVIGGAVASRGIARIAVSGGSTAPALFRSLSATGIDFERVEVWQVDERVAPDGDRDRNLGQLLEHPWMIHAMPVTDRDLAAAARSYAAALPDRFDVVHLGVGSDGHTASWPPGRDLAVLGEAESDVIVVPEFHGHDRLTITTSVVERARRRLVLVVGESKADVVRAWLDGGVDDPVDIPAARIPGHDTTIFLDRPAASQLARPI